MEKQKTIAKQVTFSGIGLHTANESTVSFRPAPVNSGIKFIRSDVNGGTEILAHIENAADIERGTNLKKNNAKIHTVEHLLSVLAGFGIDNIIIELDCGEPPVGDGSASIFVDMIHEVGIKEQEAPKQYYELKESICVELDGTIAMAIPSDKLTVSCTINFDHKEVQSQYLSLAINEKSFEKQISSARTFCFYHEVEALMDKGLIKGGSLDNAVVIGDEAIFSKEHLRFQDEFVRHKILDILGDLCLIGKPLKAHIIAIKPGHKLNIKLAKAIYDQIMKKNNKKHIKKKNPNIDGVYMDIEKIMKVLPHRHPFLLVDRVVSMEDMKAVGIKNVTVNEPFFQGHFPGKPIMPGVLIIEALAQLGGVLMLKKSENVGKLAYFMSINNAKFRKTVLPGDQLRLEVELIKARSKTGKVRGIAFVGESRVAEADLMFSLVDVEN